ncbi:MULTISPECIES: hypothetical protein [Terrabacteria group]|uniref:hypothetical protein n=1 Tax=Bacillati TaxID=1783272 RepID=UPI001C6E6242|nr:MULTISPECIES: hypothetical protein [Terrabacteria group]MBW9212980.1 hypothetical protein [Trueperella sp. zg.1013]
MDDNVQNNATVGETQDNVTVDVEETQEIETRTFTQKELDEIVQRRVSKEHERFSDYEALKEKAGKVDELQNPKFDSFKKIKMKKRSI